MPRIRVVGYALGAGAGHIVRTLAILRRLSPLQGFERILISCSPLGYVAASESIPFIRLPDREETQRLEAGDGYDALRKLLRVTLKTLQPDVLLVDTFLEGYTGKLPELVNTLQARAVGVLRTRRDEDSADLAAAVALYDAIVIPDLPGHRPEPACCKHAKRVTWCGPILMREPSEMLAEQQARLILRAPPDMPVVLACHAGYQDEAADFLACAHKAFHLAAEARACLRLASLWPLSLPELAEHQVCYFPVMELLRGVEVLVTAGGYNSIYEAAVTGTKHIVVPMTRAVDDQRARAEALSCVTATSPEHLAELIEGQLGAPRRVALDAAGGAETAAGVVRQIAGV